MIYIEKLNATALCILKYFELWAINFGGLSEILIQMTKWLLNLGALYALGLIQAIRASDAAGALTSLKNGKNI